MPRITAKKNEYLLKDLFDAIAKDMKLQHITKTQLGEELGLTQQAISAKFARMNMSVIELIYIFNRIGWTQGKIGKALGGKYEAETQTVIEYQVDDEGNLIKGTGVKKVLRIER